MDYRRSNLFATLSFISVGYAESRLRFNIYAFLHWNSTLLPESSGFVTYYG